MDPNVSPVQLQLLVFGSFISFQEAPLLMQPRKDEDLNFSSMIEGMIVMVRVCSISAVCMSFVKPRFQLPLCKSFLEDISSFKCPNIRIYIETAVGVVISYMSLLVVNWSYIWLAVFPVIAIGFIVALCKELSSQSESRQQSDHGGPGTGSASDTEGKKAALLGLVPFGALCLMGYLHADKFMVSPFLLFFSSMLWALTLMMNRLAATGIGLGVAPASVLLQRTLLIVLLVAVHAVAAELLGERVALFCLPEIAPILMWFSVRLDGGCGPIFPGNHVSWRRNKIVVVLGAVAIAVMALLLKKPKVMEDFVFPLCTNTAECCGVSGLLSCCVVLTLSQWPGQDCKAIPSLKEALKLLKIWSTCLLVATPTFLGFTYLAAPLAEALTAI